MIYTTTIISSLPPSTASKALSKAGNPAIPSDRSYVHRDDQPATSYPPEGTSIAVDNASPGGCQEIIISVVIYLTPPSSASTTYVEDTSSHGQKSAEGQTGVATASQGSDSFATKP